MNKYLKLLFLTAISFFCMYLAFKGESLNKLRDYISEINYFYLGFSLFILGLSVLFRALRWVILLKPIAKVSLKDSFGAIMIGYFGNGVFPFRAGELMRAYSISRKYSINTSKIVGSVILDRVIDLFTVGFLIIFLLPWLSLSNYNIRISLIIFLSLIVIITFTIILIKKMGLISLIKKNRLFQNKLGIKLLNIVEQVFEGLDLILRVKDKFLFLFFSISTWACYLLITYYLLKSVNLNFNLIDSAIMLILGAISLSIPALPGSAGTYEVGIKYVLVMLFNIEGEKALAYALISHASNFFPYLIIGGVYFILDGYKINNKSKLK